MIACGSRVPMKAELLLADVLVRLEIVEQPNDPVDVGVLVVEVVEGAGEPDVWM
jgi:hypothetical protein